MLPRTIRTAIIEHKASGLFCAVSDDLPGLFVAGQSDEDVFQEMPAVIHGLLEAMGEPVTLVTLDVAKLPDGFTSRSHTFTAS